MTEGKRNLIAGLLSEYDIQTADDIQDALKDLLGGTIQEMMEAEMDEHLGYDKYERSSESNYRNGTKTKRVRSKYWLSVLNSLKNRGVQDILVLCADGLSGIKEAIGAAYSPYYIKISADVRVNYSLTTTLIRYQISVLYYF